MDKLKALQHFKKVAELGNFSRAASFFNLPTSSISRSIKELEKSLNTELLIRTTRHVSLTEFGKIYYDKITHSLTLLDEADDAVNLQQKEPQGIISISATPAYGENILLPILQQFQQRYPLITYNLNLSDDLVNLNQDPVDIAIRGGYAPDEFVMAKKLIDNDFILVATPNFLSQLAATHNKTTLSVEDFNTIPCLQYRTKNGALPWWGEIDNKWVKLDILPQLICNSGKLIIDEALAHKGMAFLPAWNVKDELNEGVLVKAQTDFPISIAKKNGLGIYLLYLKPKHQLSKVTLCVNFIIEQLAVVTP